MAVVSQTNPLTEPVLEIDRLCFSYGGKKALDNLSFSIQPSEITVLLGPNGAGKTTLFSLISGLFASPSGDIKINGKSLVKVGAAALAPLGIVFQAQTLDLDLTIRQNLCYFCALRGMSRKQADQQINTELNRLDFLPRIDEKVRVLNGGHRRRVEIARSVLHDPAVLLLDEPTVGLDIPTRQGLIDDLHKYGAEQGRAILWATHLVDEIAPSDRVLILHQGKLVGDGLPAELMEKTGTASIGAAYNALTTRSQT